ncbi:hypothetical protein BH78_16460 [Pseudomonas aeruginosa C1913C]|nr:hypothetical protein BH78_16460 [Pseudomonas aeruginosa C1913C]
MVMGRRSPGRLRERAGQGSGGFDFRQGDDGVHFLDARHRRQFLEEKAFVGFDIAGDDTQHEVHRAHQYVALQHLGKLVHRLGEIGEVLAPMGVELDLGEYLGIQADLLAVEQGHLLADHPLLLQALDAPPAGRLGKSDALGDLGGGKRGFLLQQRKNTLIVDIQWNGHKYSLQRKI